MTEIHGLLAQFDHPRKLLAASRAAYAAGYRRMEAYTPFPIEGLSEAIGFSRTRVPLIVLIGGITGALTGFFMQYYSATTHYPLNIGGRPLNSWPMFIIITFELTILFAALSAVLGMLALNGLPQPVHPLFNIDSFELASRTHFFLCIESIDPNFDPVDTRRFMESLQPQELFVVPMDGVAEAT